MAKKVVTVLGEINPDVLGITLSHEHLLWNQEAWGHREPKELGRIEKYRSKITLENRGDVVYHAFDYRDNLSQTDVQVAIDEVKKFRNAGGNALCDVSNELLGRDPEALYRIAVESGLNIIMGSGNYVSRFWSDDKKKRTAEDIKNEIVDEFLNGVGYRRIKPGVIGEVGISDINDPFERMSLAGSALAQKELGCPLLIHTPIWEKAGNKILDIIEENGGDISKVALSHLDPTMMDYDYADSLANRGAYIVYDQFGMHLMSTEGIFLPSDIQRIETVLEQIKRGHLKNILISHDVAFKICLTKWGGHGYAHILENIIPIMMNNYNMSVEEINTILLENPKRFLSW
jgi:phosphotriesterase-related protein